MSRYIEEERLLMTLAEEADKFDPKFLRGKSIRIGIRFAAEAIKKEPTADVDVEKIRHAYWKRQPGVNRDPEAICSNCGREAVYQNVDDKWEFELFCPHCGAKMDGKD